MPSHAARSAVSALLLATLASAAGTAMAQRNGGTGPASVQAPPAAQVEAPIRGHHDDRILAAAVRRVERRTGGQVLSAERVPYEGRSLNRIKVVDASGRVRIYMDDPREAQRGNRQSPPARGRGQRTRGDDS